MKHSVLTIAGFSLGLALFLAAPAFAQNDEKAEEARTEHADIGLSFIWELGFGDLTSSPMIPSLSPRLEFENSYGDFDVYAELKYTATFDDPVASGLYEEIELGYNLGLGRAGTLSFILNHQNDFMLYPKPAPGETHIGILEPSVKYGHALSFGSLYGQIGFPWGYLTGVKGEKAFDSYLLAGWESNFGLVLEARFDLGLRPAADVLGYGLLASYERGMFYGELELIASKDFSGFEINPEIDLNFENNMSLIFRGEIVKDGGSWSAAPYFGVGYSF